jgi:hypothetical protein
MRTTKPYDLKVGYKNYILRFADKLPGDKTMGDCTYPSQHNHTKGVIRIIKGLEPVEKGNTILHEILHAIFMDKGLELEDKLEERIVLATANGLVAFIRDNPEFAKQLLKLLG